MFGQINLELGMERTPLFDVRTDGRTVNFISDRTRDPDTDPDPDSIV